MCTVVVEEEEVVCVPSYLFKHTTHRVTPYAYISDTDTTAGTFHFANYFSGGGGVLVVCVHKGCARKIKEEEEHFESITLCH